MKSQVDILKVPQISENKPRGLCFSKALFALGGLFLEGLIYGEKFAFQNRLG